MGIQSCRRTKLFLVTMCLSVSMFWFIIFTSYSIRPTHVTVGTNTLTGDGYEQLQPFNDTTNLDILIEIANYSNEIFPVCNKSHKTDFVIIVHSAVGHRGKRNVMRNTLGRHNASFSLTYRLVFVIGVTKNRSDTIFKKALQEAAAHRDILLVDVIDDYRNMTYKALGWIQWVSNNCSNFRYILKIDDDTVMNLRLLTKMLVSCENENKTVGICHQMSCNVWTKAKPLRGGKNRVTLQEYNETYWPDFCPGIAYLLPRKVALKLWDASKNVNFLWLDDVFVTGILRHSAEQTPFSLGTYYLENTDYKLSKMISQHKLFGHFRSGKLFESNYPVIWYKVNDVKAIT